MQVTVLLTPTLHPSNTTLPSERTLSTSERVRSCSGVLVFCLFFKKASQERLSSRSTCVLMWKLHSFQNHVCEWTLAFSKAFLHTGGVWWRVLLRVNSWPKMDGLSLFKGQIFSRHLFWIETHVFFPGSNFPARSIVKPQLAHKR